MLRKIIFRIIWALLVILAVRVFLFQTVKMRSHNMGSTLLYSDRILINKVSKGIRFPSTIFGLPGPRSPHIDRIRLPYLRLPGLSDFKRGDIIAYNFPRIADKAIDRKPIVISRIAGLPGDTIFLLDKNLFVNRKFVEAPKTVRRLYRIVTDGSEIPHSFIEKWSLDEPIVVANVGVFDILLDTICYQAIKDQSFVKTIRSLKMYAGDSSSGYFPNSNFHSWNRDQFGPFIVPYKNQTIELSIETIDRYRDIIEIHEGKEVLVSYDGVFLDGYKSSKYTFEKDYYFVLDDNRDQPTDSRMIGFIPKTHIIGTSKLILWSKGFSRFLRKPD